MLTRIDELHLPDHHRLSHEDECYFIGEYTAGKGYDHSNTNQFIYNLKKGVHRRGLPDYWHKDEAIRRGAHELRRSLNPDFLERATFVPVPPSYSQHDPLYDDRILQVLKLIAPSADVRELVRQTESTSSAHLAAGQGQDRLGPQELYDVYEIESSVCEPAPTVLAVVDDVLTTGAHFKAMKWILQERFPGVHVVGLFMARRVPDTE
jgi:hypothetical protein